MHRHERRPLHPPPALYTVRSNAYMDALTSGTLRSRPGCLFLDHDVGAPRLLILPEGEGFELSSDGVLTRNGQVVARIGSPIEAGGGIVKGSRLAPQVEPALPDACITSRAWLASPEVRSIGEVSTETEASVPTPPG